MENLWIKVFAIGVVALVILGVGLLKMMPKMLSDAVKQNRDYELKQALQVDSYYRENGTSVLQELMIQWTKMATDTDFMGKTSVPEIKELIQKTIGYSSEDTIKIAAQFFQYMYSGKGIEGEKNFGKGITYLAMIVASLKKDFTGQNLDPIEILKMNINDFIKYEELYKKYVYDIKNAIE